MENSGWTPIGGKMWVKEVPKPDEWLTFGDGWPAYGDSIIVATEEGEEWSGRVKKIKMAMKSREGVIRLCPGASSEVYCVVPFCDSTRWRDAPAPEPIKHSTDGIPLEPVWGHDLAYGDVAGTLDGSVWYTPTGDVMVGTIKTPDTSPAPPTPAEAVAGARRTLLSELRAAVERFEEVTGATVNGATFPMAVFADAPRRVLADITL